MFPQLENPFVLDYMKGNGGIAAAGTTVQHTKLKQDVRKWQTSVTLVETGSLQQE